MLGIGRGRTVFSSARSIWPVKISGCRTEAARSADSLNGRRDEVRPGHRVPPAASVKRLLELPDLSVRLEHISAD